MIEQNKRPDQDDKRNLDTSGYNFNSPAAADRPQAARDSYNQDSSHSSASGLTGDAFTNQSNVTDSTKSEIENSGPVTDDLGNTEGLDASFRPSSPFQVDSLGNVESSGKTVFDNVNQSPDRVGTINSVEENLPNESSENSTEPSITTSSAFSDSSASSNLNSTHFSTGEADPQKKKSHKNFWSGALGGLIAAVLVSACFLGVNYFWGRNNTAGTTTVYSNNGGVSSQEILNRSGTSLSNPNWEAVA
ncbi:MAG: hypothetical protein LBC43_01955, partial [Bifidobacteriaceae bacterium]|nr:hypothetical protein [Bifidobacteriaceae bacterium]